jgi:hypothetical protein
VLLKNIKIAGITGNPKKDRLVLSIKELTVGARNQFASNFTNSRNIGGAGSASGPDPLVEVDGFGVPNTAVSDPDLDFEPVIPHVQYWRESFR